MPMKYFHPRRVSFYEVITLEYRIEYTSPYGEKRFSIRNIRILSVLLPALALIVFAALVWYDSENVLRVSAALEEMATQFKQGGSTTDAIAVFYEMLRGSVS